MWKRKKAMKRSSTENRKRLTHDPVSTRLSSTGNRPVLSYGNTGASGFIKQMPAVIVTIAPLLNFVQIILKQ
jgi:hypothetical protein